VSVYYSDLVSYLEDSRVPIFGTFLKGENVHEADFGEGGLLVIGNEGKGISPDIEPYITRRITIPKYGKAESLNAALATGIVLDNMRRGVRTRVK
jgi:TrmH family RNA methyltransferase